MILLACQGQNKNTDKTGIPEETAQSNESYSSKSGDAAQQESLDCNTNVCLQLRNHDASKKTFEIYMINMVPIAGFQCDLPGINIAGSSGGLLQENGYQTKNSASKILSFSMQAKLIPAGTGVLTEIHYSNPSDEVCMTEIIFAGIGGAKLSSNAPECMRLN